MHFVQSVSVELFHKYPKGMMGFSPFTSTTSKWFSKDLWRSHHEILSEIRNLESNAQCWMCVIFCDLVEEILFKEVHTDAVHTHTQKQLSVHYSSPVPWMCFWGCLHYSASITEVWATKKDLPVCFPLCIAVNSVFYLHTINTPNSARLYPQ